LQAEPSLRTPHALGGDHTLITRQQTIEETWRIIQPLLDANRRSP